MAYKNQKKNKKHNAEIRSKRKKPKKIKGRDARNRNKPMTLEQMESIISRM